MYSPRMQRHELRVAFQFEPQEAGKTIPGVKMMTISPGTVTGHASAGGFNPADVDFLNREVGAFLEGVTKGGKNADQ